MNRKLIPVSLFFLAFVFLLPGTCVYAQDTDLLQVNSSTNGTINSSILNQGNITRPTGGYGYIDPFHSDSDLNGTPDMYTGVVHPNEETDVKSSTPEGNPLIPKYAQGGVTVDIMGHLMEGRDDQSNVSSEIFFHDHTAANGYITTLIKDFHYMSGVDIDSEE